MRATIVLLLIGCGSGTNPPGSLVCKASAEPGSPRVTVAVPANGLTGARSSAEKIGKLVDCTFEEATDRPPKVVKLEDDQRTEDLDRAIDTIRDRIDSLDDPPPPPPDDDDDDDVGVGGIPDSDPPPPPPPPPAPPRNIAPTLLEAYRIAGDKLIQPDADTQMEILQSGKSKIVGSFKMCITTTGEVSTVSQLKSTGFADYDKKLMTKIREWKYRPYKVGGDPVPVCTAVTFIYSSP